MGVGKRFGRQYRANLDEYHRTAPHRLLRVVFALILAIAAGGLLHATKGIPIVFHALLALFLGIAAILLVLKIVRILTRTRDETSYIFYGDDDEAPLNEPPPDAVGEAIFLEESPPAERRRAESVVRRQQTHGGRRVVLGCVFAMLMIGIIGVSLVFGLGWWFLNSRPQPMPERPGFPVEPPPIRMPIEPPMRPVGSRGLRLLVQSSFASPSTRFSFGSICARS